MELSFLSDRGDEPGAAGQVVPGGDVVEPSRAGERLDGQLRGGVVVLDGASAAVAQPPCRELDDRVDDGHPVRPAEQGVRRIMFGDFGFQLRTVGNIGRIGDDEVDAAVEFGQQARLGDVGADQFDGGACDVAPGVVERVLGVVDGDDAGVGPVPLTARAPAHRSRCTGRR